MKKIDKSVIDVFRNLRTYLPEKDFKKNLQMQLSKYEINREFLAEFGEVFNPDEISKYSMTDDCVMYLVDNGLFDYDTWKENVEFKNIDVLANDDFCFKYSSGTDEILSKAKNISDKIYSKYINSASETAIKNMIIHYNGPLLTIDKIVDKIDLIGMDAFRIPLVMEDLKNKESKFEEILLQSSKEIDPMMILYLMNSVYDVKRFRESIDNLTYKEIDLSEKNPEAPAYIQKAQELLANIFDRYPIDIVNSVLDTISYTIKPVLFSRDLLRHLLIVCNNISEDSLERIREAFLATNTRDELIAYAKNYNYLNLLLSIKIS